MDTRDTWKYELTNKVPKRAAALAISLIAMWMALVMLSQVPRQTLEIIIAIGIAFLVWKFVEIITDVE